MIDHEGPRSVNVAERVGRTRVLIELSTQTGSSIARLTPLVGAHSVRLKAISGQPHASVTTSSQPESTSCKHRPMSSSCSH